MNADIEEPEKDRIERVCKRARVTRRTEWLHNKTIRSGLSSVRAAIEEPHLEGASVRALSESDRTRELYVAVYVNATLFTCKETRRTSQR